MTLELNHLLKLCKDADTLIESLSTLNQLGHIDSYQIVDGKVDVEYTEHQTEEIIPDHYNELTKLASDNPALPKDEITRLWYGKLKETGFNDIESSMRMRSLPVYNESSAEYYRRAGHFLSSFEFSSDRDYAIWEYHCEGHSVRQIAKKMGIAPNTVQSVVSKHRRTMNDFQT